jgi:hypothetical protein
LGTGELEYKGTGADLNSRDTPYSIPNNPIDMKVCVDKKGSTENALLDIFLIRNVPRLVTYYSLCLILSHVSPIVDRATYNTSKQ